MNRVSFLKTRIYTTCVMAVLLSASVYARNLDSAVRTERQAITLYEQGKWTEAIPLFEKVVEIKEKTLGPEHRDTAAALNNLAGMYSLTANYTNALVLNKRAVEAFIKARGEQHVDTAGSIGNLAATYISLEEYSSAIPLLERALSIYERISPRKLSQIAKTSGLLAMAYLGRDDHSQAIEAMQKSLAANERCFGPNHVQTAESLRKMSVIYSSLGDNSKALTLVERAATISEKQTPEHPDTAMCLSSVADVYVAMEDYARAIGFYERAQIITEKSLGIDHPQASRLLNNLANAYFVKNEYPKAISLYERALAVKRKIFGTEHPEVARTYNNMANIYASTQDYNKAVALYTISLAMLDSSLGPESGDSVKILRNLAEASYLMGDVPSAATYAEKSVEVMRKQMRSILSLDERSRLNWQAKNSSYWFACVLDPENLARFVLRRKGIVLDSLTEDRALVLASRSSGEGAELLQRMRSLRERLSRIAFEQGKAEGASKIEDEIGRLQRDLASRYLGRERERSSAAIEMEHIAPAMAGGRALVDLIQFNDPKLKGDEATCIGAIITAEDNRPVFVRIDGGAAVNRAIDELRVAINQSDDAGVEAQTKFLSEKLWQPIAAKIPEGTKRLIICPDAKLNFLSFATLLESDGRFVVEKYPIGYVGSARDLARKASAETPKTMALVGNPMFDASGEGLATKEMVGMRSVEADIFGSIKLPTLPGSEAEAKALEGVGNESGWTTKVALGKEASETMVRGTRKPGILHLATHGFYLNSFSPSSSGDLARGMSVKALSKEEIEVNTKGVDPMRASGVALAGAQQTLQSWSQRKAPNPEMDGILTAEEVAALRLDGTWLVTLSACETGVGEARSGEGVFGLRRAFMIAGAENLLMTLWPVGDETTAKLMADFYREALRSGDAAASLANVQRDWLVKLREEKGLADAIREAGPFAMVVMRDPNTRKTFVEAAFEIESPQNAGRKSSKILSFESALARADAGDGYAQAVVSIYYGLGLGCAADPEKSKKYVMLSAKQRNALGIFRLAEMREAGEAMERNADQARKLMREAKSGLQAMGDDPYALVALAAIHARAKPSSPKVRELLSKASELGYEPATDKLSKLDPPEY